MLRKTTAIAFAILFCFAFAVTQFGDNYVSAEEKVVMLDNRVTELGEIISAIETEPCSDNQTLKAAVVSKKIDFKNVMGFFGYYVDETWDDVWTCRTYYSVDDNDRDKIVAESYGFNIEDQQIDIDGDGEKELVCNCTAGADSHTELYVFKRTNNTIQIGYVNWLNLDMKGLYYWGCNAVSTEYDSLQNYILIKYCDSDDSDKMIELCADCSVIEYQEWDGEDFPFIDQEEAYSRYGE